MNVDLFRNDSIFLTFSIIVAALAVVYAVTIVVNSIRNRINSTKIDYTDTIIVDAVLEPFIWGTLQTDNRRKEFNVKDSNFRNIKIGDKLRITINKLGDIVSFVKIDNLLSEECKKFKIVDIRANKKGSDFTLESDDGKRLGMGNLGSSYRVGDILHIKKTFIPGAEYSTNYSIVSGVEHW